MKGIGLVRSAAVSLASLGLLISPVSVQADNGKSATPVVSKAVATQAADIVLLEGAFTGRVVDQQGTPQVGKDVVVKQGGKEVARVKTDDKGIFSVKNVRPGNYTAASGKTDGVFRVWNEKTAPPAAKGHALLVMGQNGARGQFGSVDPTIVVLSFAVLATLVVVAITLNKVNDLEDEVSQIPKSN